MKVAKQEILEVLYKGSLYNFSIVEKQNDSGIMFNDRLFFLLPEKHIGYLSEVKIDEPPEKVDFSKAKIIISISHMKSVVVLEKQLHIKLLQTEANKKVEKDWILRMSTTNLAKKWYDRLKQEKMIEMQKKSTLKNNSLNYIPEQFKSKKNQPKSTTKIEPQHSSPSKKVLSFTRSESFTYNVKPEPQKERVQKIETGVGQTPINSEISFKNKVIQTKETGTFMSHNADSVSSKPPTVINEQKVQQRKPIQPQKIAVKQKPAEAQQVEQQPQPSTIVNKIYKTPNQGKTDRSFGQIQQTKSVRSEPATRKIETFRFNCKQSSPIQAKEQGKQRSKAECMKIQEPQLQQNKNSLKASNKASSIKKEEQPNNIGDRYKSINIQNKEKSISIKNEEQTKINEKEDKHKSIANSVKDEEIPKSIGSSKKQKQEISIAKSIKSQKKQQIINSEKAKLQPKDLTLSNKRYISKQQFDILNTSTPIDYLDRTSKLINSSATKLNNPQGLKRVEEPPQHIPVSIQKSKQPRANIRLSQTAQETKFAKSVESKPSPRNNGKMNQSIPEVKQQYDSMNQSDELHRVIKDEFSSIQKHTIGNEEAFISELPLPWTYKYLQYGESIFEEYLSFCKDLLEMLVQDMRQPVHRQHFKLNYTRYGIRNYQIDDLQVKIATISIEDAQHQQGHIGPKERICNRDSIKLLKNQFNHFHILYQYLGPSSNLKVPLVCTCEVNGFMGLFKTLSISLGKQIRMRDIQADIHQLRYKTKINQNFFHNYNKNIIQLDQKYYKGISQESETNFDCFFIQEIEDYLPGDGISEHKNGALLRKQLISQYAQPLQKENRSKPIQKLHGKSGKQSEQLSKHLLQTISQVVLEIDSMNVYFLSSSELSTYFHQKGVNMRYLGHIYRHVSLPFQRRVLMSEMSARCCKALLRKTMQDIIMEDDASPQVVAIKICDFLNCVTSNSLETAALWKVLSAHAYSYFGAQLNFEQIDRGYFLAALVENCRLRVAWDRLNPQDVFKESILFTQKNLSGIEPTCHIYLPHHNQFYRRCLEILQEPHSQQVIPQLKQCLESAQNYPTVWGSLSLRVKLYLSLFMSPQKAKAELGELDLYPSAVKSSLSRGLFDLLLMEIKWQLKSNSREGYIKSCDQFIRTVSRFFGEFHPVFSQLYDIFSTFHQNAQQYQDAITFAKSSLVNILKVCGTNHERTSECYYNLALCNIKAGKKEQAFSHMSKARSIFQANGRTNSLPYAAIELKMALVYLNQDQGDLCLKSALTALEIFSREQISTCQDELVDCYEMITRCYQIQQERAKIQEVAERCENILSEVTSANNLQRLLKIIIYPLLSETTPENASLYLDIISQFSNPSNYLAIAIQRLRVRIAQRTLLTNLSDYISNLPEIQRYLGEANLLQEWQNFKEIYPRETINDFLALTEELIAFLSEGFVSGSLREAL